MFITHGIPSFYKLLCISIYRFADCVSKKSNSNIMAYMTLIVYIHSPIRQWWRSVLYSFALFLFCGILLFYGYYCTYICYLNVINYFFLNCLFIYFNYFYFFSVPQCIFNLFEFVTPMEISYIENYV